MHEYLKRPEYVDLMRRLGALGDGNQDKSKFFFFFFNCLYYFFPFYSLLPCSLSSHIASDPPRWNSCWYCFVICRYTLTRWMGSSLFVLGICLEEGKYHIRMHTHTVHLWQQYWYYVTSNLKVRYILCSFQRGQPDRTQGNNRKDRGQMNISKEDIMNISRWGNQMHFKNRF